jgi:HD-GYP domain-containing protein (c-di-GMP phosphodiesterase class II)
MTVALFGEPEPLAREMKADPRFAAYSVRAVGSEGVEVRSGAASVLLLWPEGWLDAQKLRSRLAGPVQTARQVVLVGTDEELDHLSAEAASARLLGWSLPMGLGRLSLNLKSIFSGLTERHLAADQQGLVARYRYELDELVAIARSLSSEQDIDRLLGLILEKSRFVTGADAGSIYVLEGDGPDAKDKKLRFKVTQNESVAMDLGEFTMDVSARSIVGNAVLAADSINIPDLYSLSDDNPWGAQHDRSFDERMGYESHSMLTVPMLNHHGEVIGVVQLINKKRDPEAKLEKPADFERQVIPFDQRAEELAVTLAAQAGISLENALLYNEVRNLFEGLVQAAVGAIESRDPTTSGHSLRVATLTRKLAEEVNRCGEGELAGVSFDEEQLREIEYACLLHDFGKVGVREHILVKANKLYDTELDVIRHRFEYLRAELEAEKQRRKLEALEGISRGDGERGYARAAAEIDEELNPRIKRLGEYLEIVEKANRPSILAEESSKKLAEMAECSYRDSNGCERPYLTRKELASLQVKRGSLTREERAEIESHVVHSTRFLEKIPWGRTLKGVPEIAARHHEKLDGSGYPEGVTGERIPIQSKMMAIADIFDALTASDRPYKKAMPWQKALAIISEETGAGKYDPELCRLFIDAKIYESVLVYQSDPPE